MATSRKNFDSLTGNIYSLQTLTDDQSIKTIFPDYAKELATVRKKLVLSFKMDIPGVYDHFCSMDWLRQYPVFMNSIGKFVPNFSNDEKIFLYEICLALNDYRNIPNDSQYRFVSSFGRLYQKFLEYRQERRAFAKKIAAGVAGLSVFGKLKELIARERKKEGWGRKEKEQREEELWSRELDSLTRRGNKNNISMLSSRLMQMRDRNNKIIFQIADNIREFIGLGGSESILQKLIEDGYSGDEIWSFMDYKVNFPDLITLLPLLPKIKGLKPKKYAQFIMVYYDCGGSAGEAKKFITAGQEAETILLTKALGLDFDTANADKPDAIIFLPKYDYNDAFRSAGTFYYLKNVISYFPKTRVQVVSRDTEVFSAIQDFQIAPKLIWMSMHGEPGRSILSTSFLLIMSQLVIPLVGDLPLPVLERRTIDNSDFAQFKRCFKNLPKGAVIVIDSCSSGKKAILEKSIAIVISLAAGNEVTVFASSKTSYNQKNVYISFAPFYVRFTDEYGQDITKIFRGGKDITEGYKAQIDLRTNLEK